MLATTADLGFPCRLLAGFGLAYFLQAKLSSFAPRLLTLLSLYLPFRRRRCAPLGLLLLLLVLQLSQIAVDPHFFYLAPLLLDPLPLCRRAKP